MSAADMGFTSLDREQRAHTADITGGDLEPWMPALELVSQNIDRQVVAAGAKDSALDFFGRPEQLDLHLLARVNAFGKARNSHQPVRLDHSRNDAGAAAQRHGNELVFHPSERHPDQFLNTEM